MSEKLRPADPKFVENGSKSEILNSKSEETEDTTQESRQQLYEWSVQRNKLKQENRKNPKGNLGMTAEDHQIIGSTPLLELSENPGKTLADLKSDEELLDYLKSEEELIYKISQPEYANQPYFISIQDDLVQSFVDNLAYLNRIGRLPAEYAEVETDDYENQIVQDVAD